MRSLHFAKKSDFLESRIQGACVDCELPVPFQLVVHENDDYLEATCPNCSYHNWFHLRNIHGMDKL